MSSTSTNKSPETPALTRSALSSDISTLLSLPAQTSHHLSSLLNSSLPTPAASQPSASQLLSTFSTSSKDQAGVEAGVNLSAAYTRDMRALQRQGLEAGLERAGAGIEWVRERAEGVQSALGAVKL